jgi:hypothetical protein
MDEKVRSKIAKVYELVNRGENGEKVAADAALNRLMKKYNLDEEYIKNINKQDYRFKYSSNMELWLFSQLKEYFFTDKEIELFRDTYGARDIVAKLEYLDFVMLSSAYEYFRRHMKAQFNKICVPKINRCRTAKTRKKRREELQNLFFSRYIIASKIYRSDQVRKIDTSKLSEKELRDRMALDGIKGGDFKTQVSTGLYLEQ